MKEPGYVYILTNPSFKEDWVKIGKSSRPVDIRSKELDNTAVPLPFEIYATLKTVKYSEVERAVHQTIDSLTDLRIRQNREFFNITPSEALNILKRMATMLDDAEIFEYKKDPAPREDVKTGKIQPRHEKRKAFWAEFIQYCKDNDGIFDNISPTGDNWISKGINTPYISIIAAIGYNFARIDISFKSNQITNKKVYDYLYSRKDEIESEYRQTLTWQRLNDKITCSIKDEREFNCFEMEDKTEIFSFLKDASDKLSVIFHNYILDYKS